MAINEVPPQQRPILGVGAVIWNEKGEIVLIRRGNEPRRGEWSIPGGRVEWGETILEAISREVREETGLEVEIAGLIEVVDSLSRADDGGVTRHYVLVDFAARTVAGELRAGDDASEARWVPHTELAEYKLWSETLRIIALSARLIER